MDHSYVLSSVSMEEDSECSVFGSRTNIESGNESRLVELVAQSPFLFNKKDPKHVNRDLLNTWMLIGNELPVPLSGSDAEKLFYKFRQRFGKEKKKGRDSTPRSGAGAGTPTYTPDWVMYKDLMVLTDHIQPRERNTTNYKGLKPPVNNPSQFVPPQGTSQSMKKPALSSHSVSFFSAIGRASASNSIPRQSSTPIHIRNGNQVSKLPENEVSGWLACSSLPSCSKEQQFVPVPENVIDGGEVDMDGDSSLEFCIQLSMVGDMDFSSLTLPGETFSSSSVTQRTSASTALRGNQVPSSKIVPEPDMSYKKRKREVDMISKHILESSKDISKLAASVGAAIEKAAVEEQKVAAPQTPRLLGNFSPEVQVALSSLGLALSKVKENDVLPCMLELLNLVHHKYLKKD